MLLDMPGALWTRDMIDACHVAPGQSELWRVVIAIDPAGSSNRNSDETGIIVAGVDFDGYFWVLQDLSGKFSPDGWARKAVAAYREWLADRIVAERNFGGDMVEATIRNVDATIPLRLVTASRGKAIRAEPIAALYEQRRVRHLGAFTALEDQMCQWDPAASGPSPDRVDALVWSLTDLNEKAAIRRTVLL